jgi:hypothetical protein
MPEPVDLSQRQRQSETRDAVDSFSTDLAWATRKQILILSQTELEVLRRPARIGLSRRCGLTPSIVASASLF